MARLARVVAVDVAHHVTQRGNRREYILTSDAERMVYLDLLRQAIQLHSVSLIGYCLMSNHVHLVLIPHQQNSLALAMKDTHGPYASYWNASHGSSGHAWQGRFYSCPLDPMHLWEALRYTELNQCVPEWLHNRSCGHGPAQQRIAARRNLIPRSAWNFGNSNGQPNDGKPSSVQVKPTRSWQRFGNALTQAARSEAKNLS